MFKIASIVEAGAEAGPAWRWCPSVLRPRQRRLRGLSAPLEAARKRRAVRSRTSRSRPNLVRSNDEVGVYSTPEQLAGWVKQASRAIIGGNYRGVDIDFDGVDINVFDGTATKAAKQIEARDLVGQPTWIGFQQMSFKCPMRGDLRIGDTVKMPNGALFTSTVVDFLDPRSIESNKITFTGNASIYSIHHYGNSRQADASSWTTVVEAYTLPSIITQRNPLGTFRPADL
jgi:hypothetical protein